MNDSIKCGFSNIVEIVGGFQESDLVVIGSRPDKGKSTFAKQIALNVAVDNQIPAMFFSPAESGMRFAFDLLCLGCGRTQSWMEESIPIWSMKSLSMRRKDFLVSPCS